MKTYFLRVFPIIAVISLTFTILHASCPEQPAEASAPPYLGLVVSPLSRGQQIDNDLRSIDPGVQVIGVDHLSPAEQARLRKGDVILYADDKPVRSQEDLDAILLRLGVSAQIKLTILREGERSEITLPIMPRPRGYLCFEVAPLCERDSIRATLPAELATLDSLPVVSWALNDAVVSGEELPDAGSVITEVGAQAAGSRKVRMFGPVTVIGTPEMRPVRSISDLSARADSILIGDVVVLRFYSRGKYRTACFTAQASPLLFLAACLLPLSGPAAAEEPSSTAAARPRIGLALSGGGARGAAHVGVLKVLEEHRIPIDYIAGTSMGAIVGGLYASGLSAAELEKIITTIDWTASFSDLIPRTERSFRRKQDDDLYLVKNKPGVSGLKLLFPPGLLDGQKIDLLLKRHTLPVVEIRDFDKLGIPFRAVAADLVTGEPVVIDRGDLALALRASMSIPVVFAPREIDGRLLVDGGIGRNLPVEVVRQMGADVIIAVDISTPLLEREQLRSVLAVSDQILGIMTRRDTDRQIASLNPGDVLIRPDLGGITTASFDRAAEAIPAGTEAAEASLGALARLSVSPEEYREYAAARTGAARAAVGAPPVIEEVRIVNRSRLADGVIAAKLHVETGKPLDVERLEKDLDQIFGLELFESVYYDLSAESGRMVLTVTLRERSWGPNYLQSGVAIFEDFEGPNFNLAIAYTRTAINRLNGEWRIGVQVGQEPGAFTELYQPLEKSLRWFLHLGAAAGERSDNVFDAEGNKISELGLRSYGGEIAVGRELGTFGEIRAGILREAGTISTQVGARGTPDLDFNTGEAYLRFSVDELDNVNFPRSGGDLRLRLSAGLEEPASDVHYEQGMLEGSCAASLGRWTGLLEMLAATTRASDAPYQRLFRLGGFTRLSGLEQNELIGQHAALLSALLYRRIADLTMLSLYAGASLEYGNVFQTRDEIALEKGRVAGSAFLGLDTLIGPIYFAYGVAERGRGNFYFFLGKRL